MGGNAQTSDAEALMLLERAKARQRLLQVIRHENKKDNWWGFFIVVLATATPAFLGLDNVFVFFACIGGVLLSNEVEHIRLRKRFDALVRFLESEEVIRD